jgi:cytochrome P450
LLYEIARNPEIQERLVMEISSIVGEKEHPSWEDLQRMPLLRNCVKEVMRLYSPTGGLARILRQDAVLLGYHIPAGVSKDPVSRGNC